VCLSSRNLHSLSTISSPVPAAFSAQLVRRFRKTSAAAFCCSCKSVLTNESVEAKAKDSTISKGLRKEKKLNRRSKSNEYQTSREASKETERKLKGCSSSHSNAQADNAIGWLFAVRKSHTKKRDSEGASTALHEMAECESLQAIQSRLQRLGNGARERLRDSLRLYEFRVWELVEMVVCWLGSIIRK
jgi:hypothetical protein